MTSHRIHRAISDDGVEIAGRVHGEGPPVVLVHGGLGSGEFSYRFLAPILSRQVTCYLVSMRGRGLSGDHADQSRGRFVRDVVAFVHSIGDPVGLMGHSSGATVALEASAHTTSVSALALYEPYLREIVDEATTARNWDAVTRIAATVEEGRLADAARIFAEDIALATDQELATLSEANAYEGLAPQVRQTLQEIAQSGRPTVSDPGLLDQVTMPVLLLHGTDTHPSYKAVVRHLTNRLADARVREIAGAGHLGPQLAPDAVADELARFFTAVEVPS